MKINAIMKWFKDIHNRQIRLSSERQDHIEVDHPEMSGQIDKIQDTLASPDVIVKSRVDPDVELFYQHYNSTPVTEKYLCVVVKRFIVDKIHELDTSKYIYHLFLFFHFE
jgi:hypothetical protein